MAVALGATQTTLWDQIEYAGEPEDFVWVLPVRGGVGVELADNAFFEALEQGTQLRFTAPPLRSFCPDPCGGAFASPSAAERDSSADAGASGVTVYHQATIGPYETVTIGSEDPDVAVDGPVGDEERAVSRARRAALETRRPVQAGVLLFDLEFADESENLLLAARDLQGAAQRGDGEQDHGRSLLTSA